MLALLLPLLRAFAHGDGGVDDALPWLVAGAAGAVLFCVLRVVADPIGYAAAATIAAQLRRRLMTHVTSLGIGWFTTQNKTRLARAVTADVGDAAHLTVTIGGPVLTATLFPATVAVVTLFVAPPVGLALCAIAVAAAIALRRAARVSADAETRLEQAAAEVAGQAIEFGQAQPVLRAARSAAGTGRMRAALDRHRVTYRDGMRRARTPFFVYSAVVSVGFVVTLVLIAALLDADRIDPISAVVLLVLVSRFLQSIGTLIDLIGAVRAMTNKISRIERLLDVAPLPVPAVPATVISTPEVAFDDVVFSYPGTDTCALDGVTLRCRPGSTTALVGPSGSGKTTVVRLIARFFDVDAGRVTVGGVDVRELDPRVLLDEIAIIFQDVYLFDDTIENNLLIARPGATRGELDDAARAARLDAVVSRLPDGWSTRVGEAGARLSGGERQRVAIARAILKRARIVLVDEAASALDPENERAVAAAVAGLEAPGRTTIVIAHRPATLETADQVIAMGHGRIAEQGSPSELLRTGGTFGRIHDRLRADRSWRIGARR